MTTYADVDRAFAHPLPWRTVSARSAFKRVYGFQPGLTNEEIIVIAEPHLAGIQRAQKVGANPALLRKRQNALLADLYEAVPKLDMPTRWFRWRWLTAAGPTVWEYEDSGFAPNMKRAKRELRALMEERIHERANDYGRASAEWDFVDPPRTIVHMRVDAISEKIKRLKRERDALKTVIKEDA